MPTNTTEWIIFIIQCFGVVSFSISGCVVAMNRKMDVFGVIVLAITTTFGGGLMRDLMIGRIPPALLTDPACKVYLVIIVIISTLCMIVTKFKPIAKFMLRSANGQFLNIVDAIGLSIFCVIGVNSAVDMGYGGDVFLLTFVGGITGVGGGILRDLICMQIPMIFRKHVYALPTIVASLFYVFSMDVLGRLPSMLIVIAFVTVVRFLAARYHWNLPVFDIEALEKEEFDRRKAEEEKKREKKLDKKN